MNVLKRASHLLKHPETAAPIHVACLIKQAIAADEVIIMQPITDTDQAVKLIWTDGPIESNYSLVEQPLLSTERLLDHDQIRDLAKTNVDGLDGSVHYFVSGFLWKQNDVGSGPVQAIRLLREFAGRHYIMLWIRYADTQFEEADIKRFEMLCGSFRASPRMTDSSAADVQPVSTPLSPTELRVLGLLQQGLTERAIAERLGRSPNTIHVHVRSMYRKFSVHSRSELLKLTEGLPTE